MEHIVVDSSFAQQLSGAETSVILFDAAGKRLGYFTPEIKSTLYVGIGPSVSEEELDRRERTDGGRTLHEILHDLEKRS